MKAMKAHLFSQSKSITIRRTAVIMQEGIDALEMWSVHANHLLKCVIAFELWKWAAL
jgi:hypothetical protein